MRGTLDARSGGCRFRPGCTPARAQHQEKDRTSTEGERNQHHAETVSTGVIFDGAKSERQKETAQSSSRADDSRDDAYGSRKTQRRKLEHGPVAHTQDAHDGEKKREHHDE